MRLGEPVSLSHIEPVSGFMNFGFGLAGMISPVVFGAIIDASWRWDYPFIASLCLLLVGAVSALFLRPDLAFEDPQKA